MENKNQCDGCIAGLPKQGNYHFSENGHIDSGCTADRYTSTPAPVKECEHTPLIVSYHSHDCHESVPAPVKEESFSDFIRAKNSPEKEKIMMDVIKAANQEQKDLMAKQVDTQEWWERTIDEAANENMDNSFLEPISKTGAEVLKGFIGSIIAETKIKTVEEMIQKINKLLIPQAYKDKNQTMWNTAIKEVIKLLESNE